MRLWVFSDIHAETMRGWDLPVVGERPMFDVAVIAGDLITRMERGVAWILRRITDHPVIYIAGNHESYGADIDRTVEKARALAEGSNVHVLQNDSVRIGDVTFTGATFWTDFDLFGDPARAMAAAEEYMNDYRRIRIGNYTYRLRPWHTLRRHHESREFIARELIKPTDGARVVVTHTAPHGRSAIHGAFADQITSACYSSDASDLMALGAEAAGSRRRLTWIHGHTHETYDLVVDGVRIATNAKGYGPYSDKDRRWENRGFDPGRVIEI